MYYIYIYITHPKPIRKLISFQLQDAAHCKENGQNSRSQQKTENEKQQFLQQFRNFFKKPQVRGTLGEACPLYLAILHPNVTGSWEYL